MEFVTIHDLSRELNVPARVVRYRLINLIADGKLKEGEDFRRDEFKDDQHFVWRINPLSFLRETGLKPAPEMQAVNEAGNHSATPDNGIVNEQRPAVNHLTSTVTQPQSTDSRASNGAVIKPDNSLEREMIDLLKEQIKVKDGQLREQGEQLKDVNDLNVKLTGTMLQQNQKIENLLRLTGGKNSESEMVNEVVNTNGGGVNESVNHQEKSGESEPTAKVAR